MNEVQRLQYLHAMGIDSYVPRRVLPGARPSALCEWPALLPEPEATAVVPAAAPASPANAVDRQVMARLQQDLGTPSRKTAVNRPAVAPAVAAVPHPASPVSSVQQFRLAIFLPVTGFVVLVPAEHMEKQHLHLLDNILRAVGVSCDGLVPADTFAWPPRQQAAVRTDAGLVAARETLHALLEGYQLKHGPARVLVFAAELAEQLFVDAQLESLDLYCLPDLDQMLRDSHFKKITWQKIRRLAP